MTRSLRLRLFLIILLPLALLAIAVGVWRITIAQRTAGDLFDRNLVFTALAVSRDVALFDGDAISPETQALLGDAAGGPVRYHVYGPDGVLVTGYAVPPVPLGRRMPADQAFAYYDASYRGDAVRVLRLRDDSTIDGLSGIYTITVWQSFEARNGFARALAMRAVAVIAILIGAVALLVWFGVRVGLKPLTDLEDAISRRSPEDLSPIRRSVPIETRGLVTRLNGLFERVGATLAAQTAFVADAAHQLRNPIAGLRALGEAIQTAPTLEAARTRADDLVAAAARAGDLANKLLTLERARAEAGVGNLAPVDLGPLVARTVADLEADALSRNVILRHEVPEGRVCVAGDPVMLGEALANLVDNALVHGGPGLSRIDVVLSSDASECALAVSDDGQGVAASDVPVILARFGQAEPGSGSGLGLSIAEAIATRHGGRLEVREPETGFSVALVLPVLKEQLAASAPSGQRSDAQPAVLP